MVLKIKWKSGDILKHLLVWVTYIFYELSIILVLFPSSIKWNEVIWGFLLNAILFYSTSYLILPRLYIRKQLYVIMFELCFTICLYLLASAVISTYIFSGGGRSYHLLLSLLVQKEFLAQHIWRATWFIGLGAGFWLALKSISAEKKLRLLEKEKFLQQLHEAELQQEIVISQLAFFKSQINPHFLFNTINFFYASIYPLSKPLAKSILMLSNIMRYAMNSDNKSVWADLITEIEVIEDFIKLNQLRFDSKLQINFIINGQPEHQKIISFLMMTLVENAFKYGDLEDAKNPLSIVIDIFEDKVNMQIQNKISNHKVENGHGIGIKNLENRLKLAYQDNYFFLITKSESVYKCDLMLNFY